MANPNYFDQLRLSIVVDPTTKKVKYVETAIVGDQKIKIRGEAKSVVVKFDNGEHFTINFKE